MAAGLVKQIQQGVDLYKQTKEQFVQVKKTANEVVAIGKEVHGFFASIEKFFGKFFQGKSNTGSVTQRKQTTAKSVDKPKKSEYVAVDETQVKIDIVKNLTEFFKLQEQLAAHIRAEEEKSLTVYDPDQNHMEAALKRVMAQQEMDRLVVQIRECLVYSAPPEMGALYSSVYEMKDKIEEEQTQARLAQEAKERLKEWQRQEAKRNFRAKQAYLLGTLALILYLWLWFLAINQLVRK